MFANHFNIPACLEIVGVVGVEPLGQPVPAISAKDVGLDKDRRVQYKKEREHAENVRDYLLTRNS